MEAAGKGLSRREFVLSLLRIVALGGIGAVVARLFVGRTAPPGETCVGEGVCRGCSAFSTCGLPSALSARERAPWAGGGR